MPNQKSFELEELAAEYHQRFVPVTPEERFLVDSLVDADWQLRRLRKARAQLWHHELKDAAKSSFGPGLQQECPLGHVFDRATDNFVRLYRIIYAGERSYYRALNELNRLQSTRASTPDRVPDPGLPTPGAPVWLRSVSTPAPDPPPAASDPTARRLGYSSVSFSLGILVCSSIVPEFTLRFRRWQLPEGSGMSALMAVHSVAGTTSRLLPSSLRLPCALSRPVPRYTLSRMGTDLSESLVTKNAFGPAPFQANVELLRTFLAHREEIVESIEGVLDAQRKPVRYLQDHSLLSRDFEDCFFRRAAVTAGQTRLRMQLEEAQWAAGFKPRPVHDLHNDLIHPAEMMIRAFYCWQQTRWPGRSGRVHYAHTLFNLYILRWLQLLSMRLWDEGPGSPGGRLSEIQGVLDALWKSSPAGQPALVRDARWLIPLAQSLITDELRPYFEVARQVAETLPEADVLEIQKAHVRMIGGHLMSQIRYYCTKDGLSIHEPSVVLRTRTSNALDFALLVQGLVGLLQAYDRALESGDERMRLEMAGAVCQGISADPELFVNRLDLLNAYSMIEHVFIAADGQGHAAYSSQGERHVRLLKEYTVLIKRLIQPLRDDLPRFRPVDGRYSPYGMIFGLPSHLIEHMALKAIEHDAETRFSLEDVFADGDTAPNPALTRGAERLAWVNGWRRLPHIPPEIRRLYDYPQQFAEGVYGRIEGELRGRGSDSRTGRLYLAFGEHPEMDSKASPIPELPARYLVCSDSHVVSAGQAEVYDRAQLLAGRREAHFLVSYETPGGWIALKKELLTEILGAGRDAWIRGLPPQAAQVLRLMCRDLTMPVDGAGPPCVP